MSLSRKSNNQSNSTPGMLLHAYLKNRCKDSAERKQKIEQVRLIPGGIETIKEAMLIDQALSDRYQAELNPLQAAWQAAEYDHYETHVLDRSEGTTIEVGVGGQRKELDQLISTVRSKYSPELEVYNQLSSAVSHDKYERQCAAKAEREAAAKREAENEFNNILGMTRSRAAY